MASRIVLRPARRFGEAARTVVVDGEVVGVVVLRSGSSGPAWYEIVGREYRDLRFDTARKAAEYLASPVCRFCGHPMTSPLVSHSGSGCYVG